MDKLDEEYYKNMLNRREMITILSAIPLIPYSELNLLKNKGIKSVTVLKEFELSPIFGSAQWPEEFPIGMELTCEVTIEYIDGNVYKFEGTEATWYSVDTDMTIPKTQEVIDVEIEEKKITIYTNKGRLVVT